MEIPPTQQKRCPFCSELILVSAAKCKHCGEFLNPALRPAIRQYRDQDQDFSRGAAAVLSVLVPGLGQMYRGNVFTGFVWLGLTVIGYIAFILPGLVMHLLCVIEAATTRSR